MISVADARTAIVAALNPIGVEEIAVMDALGRVLAVDAVAKISHPSADVSAMDGYAVRAADASLGAALKVIGTAAAGHPWNGTLGPGQAVRIFTGAYVPEGADSIVIQEDTAASGDHVTINEAATKGRHIRPMGQDFKTGETILSAPRRLTFRDVGLLAAMNLPRLSVFKRPRIGVLSTGDEVVMPGDEVKHGQLVSANGPGLCAFIASQGATPMHLGIASDDATSLKTMAQAASDLDMLVTTGGVSVGDHDLIAKVLGENGLSVNFHKIAMRPGKPLLFGSLKGKPFMGLPGNPVSAMVCAILFLGPALEKMQGLPGAAPATTKAKLGSALKANDKREDYLRGSLTRDANGELTATPFPKQDSGMISSLARADCLVIRAPFAPEATAGQLVEIITLTI
ncbi:MAG: molybdopterin molybdenumtransferase MoeA [Rhodospirillaceae bacterium]|nr:molybdopterin molybdenumtransferase MoeA [Rhodospirillaceae bacterium]